MGGSQQDAVGQDAVGQAVSEHAARVPAPALRGLVDSYVGYRQAGAEPARHRGLPSRSLTLIFTLDEPLVLAAHPDPAQPPESYQALAGGLHTAPAIIEHDGRQSGIQLGVTPLGARILLGVPAGELAQTDVPAAAVLGPLAAEITVRLRAAADWPERFAILDDLLTARAAQAGRPGSTAVCPEVSFAWRTLLQTAGTATVGSLAAATGWSERHLRSRFRQEIGLAPKAAGRVIRFERARRDLQRRAVIGQPLDLAGLAAAAGYFDQAHLDRDFRALAGCSPTAWVAEEFRNFQATAV